MTEVSERGHSNASVLPTSLRALLPGIRAFIYRVIASSRQCYREIYLRITVRRVSGERRIDARQDEFVVVSLVRDGGAYLNEFLAHYRALGARHFVFLDNGSTDGFVERLADEPDVTILCSLLSFGKYKLAMRRYLVRRFGRGNWVLSVDIDELFDYPFRDRRPMAEVLSYLNRRRFTAVAAHLLDMFPAGSLVDAAPDWRKEHRFYDIADLQAKDYREHYSGRNVAPSAPIQLFIGGMRASRFGVYPMLTKHPLLFPSAGIKFEGPHHVSGARTADFTAVLLHYKYVAGFIGYMRRAVEEGGFYRDSMEYRGYLSAIDSQPELRLESDTMRELVRIEQLLDEGFLIPGDLFAADVSASGEH